MVCNHTASKRQKLLIVLIEFFEAEETTNKMVKLYYYFPSKILEAFDTKATIYLCVKIKNLLIELKSVQYTLTILKRFILIEKEKAIIRNLSILRFAAATGIISTAKTFLPSETAAL